jgi:hypothetical protein
MLDPASKITMEEFRLSIPTDRKYFTNEKHINESIPRKKILKIEKDSYQSL